MDIERYVLDNYLNKITKQDSNGKKFILEDDIEKLSFTSNEKKFVFQIMEKNKIELKRELIEKNDRSQRVSEFDFGEKETYGLEERDIPEKAEIEYTDDGVLVFENYEKLDEFIEKEFIPNNVVMTRKRDSEDPDKEFVSFVQKKDETTMKQYRKDLYPTIQLNQIVKLKLSEKENAHVMDYLNRQGIVVRGRDASIDQEFENYDYYTTYKNQILPNSLTNEENNQKFALYFKFKDPVIKEQLILGNLRLVPYVAWKYSVIYDQDIHELESYGYEGLIESIDKYDPSLGYSFTTFSIEYIKGYIKRGRLELDNLSRGNWAETFYKCRKMVEESKGQTLNENPDLAFDVCNFMMKAWQEELSKDPNAKVAIRPSKDPEILERQMKENLDRIRLTCMEDIDNYVLDNSVDLDESFENIKEVTSDFDLDNEIANTALKEDLNKALSTLTEKEETILRLRFGLDGNDPKTLEEVGKMYNISSLRVLNIEEKALRKLRLSSRSTQLGEYIGLNLSSKKPRQVESKRVNINHSVESDLDVGFPMDPELEKFKEDWDSVTSKLRR